jgi:hypothetical protein
MRRAALFLAIILLAALPALAQTTRGRIEGRISDTSGLPLPGVTVSLTHEVAAPLVVHTDQAGHFAFDVPRGRYTLTAELSGFQTAVRPNLTAGAEALAVDVVLDLGGFREETQVIAQAPRVFSTSEPTAPVTVDKEIIKMAPVQGMRYDSALPLLPGAVRGPDGLISISGARSWQGTVLVDGMREGDPVSGEPRLSLPISAIDNVQVYSPLPPAEAGPATGGVTSVNTRAAVDTYMFNVLGLLPRPRFSGDGTSGIESWQPIFGFSGPLVKGRVWLAQSVEYRYERFQFETVAGKQDSSVHGWTTFSRLDVKLRSPHHFTLRLVVTPDSNTHYGLDAFAPSESVPNLLTTGVSVAVLDRMALGGSSTLDSHLYVKRVTLDLTSDETRPYVMGHDRTRGSYYRALTRTAYRFEAGSTWSKAVAKWNGEHLFKAGFAVGYMTVSGLERARPVDYVRSDGTLSRHYEFSGPGDLSASLADGGLFVQDTWIVGSRLKVDLGARWDANTAATGTAFWPRAVMSYDLRPNSTKISSGIGGFIEKPLLAASVFPQRQARRETLYDATGQVPESSRLFTNRMVTALAIPRSLAWNVQLDQSLKGGWMARAAYQERAGRREYTVQPTVLGRDAGELALSGAAESHSRSVEATAGFRSPHGSHQFYVSYVRSWTEGYLNDLNTIAGSFGRPQVLPDERAPLPADVPHRLLAWGIISLPWRFTVSPFMEVRSGFPFTRIDENWNVVGTRNDSRFSMFMSFDLAVEKALQLPFGFPARLGLKFFNLAGRNNGRSIQRDVERPDFGRTYDPVRRQLRGTLEISWNR